MHGGHGESIGHLFQRDRGRSLDSLRLEPRFAELRRKRHRETTGVRCADELLWIGTFFVFETGAEGICDTREHAALCGNSAAAVFEAALPDRGSFSLHVLESPFVARSRVHRLVLRYEGVSSPRTLQSVVDSLGEHGRKTALVVFGKKDRHRWSFKELADCARSFANGLVEDGFKRGDTIALFAENSPEWIAAALGIIRAGMVAVPLDVQLGTKTLTHILRDSDARAVITTQRRGGGIEKVERQGKTQMLLLDV